MLFCRKWEKLLLALALEMWLLLLLVVSFCCLLSVTVGGGENDELDEDDEELIELESGEGDSQVEQEDEFELD